MISTFSKKKILVVVAHPDDEVLGLGASMNRLIKESGCEIRVLILGEGITSRSEKREPKTWAKELKIHQSNIKKATALIGYRSVKTFDLPDNRFDTVALLDIVKMIEKEKQEFRPEIIFTHHQSDTNIDHRLTFDAVITASRPLPGEPVKTIFSFETPSSTEWQAPNYANPFLPDFYIPVSRKNVKAKIDAMECYEFERRKYPHPRSPEALEVLAKRHGITIGVDYAEAFMLIRGIMNFDK